MGFWQSEGSYNIQFTWDLMFLFVVYKEGMSGLENLFILLKKVISSPQVVQKSPKNELSHTAILN